MKRINFLTDLLILKVRLYNLRLDRCAVTKNAINVAIESLIMSDEEGTAADTPEKIFCQITLKS